MRPRRWSTRSGRSQQGAEFGGSWDCAAVRVHPAAPESNKSRICGSNSGSYLFARPAVSVMPPMIRYVLGLDARAERQFVQCIEQAAVGHEKERLAGVLVEQAGQHADGARAGLVPLFRVG